MEVTPRVRVTPGMEDNARDGVEGNAKGWGPTPRVEDASGPLKPLQVRNTMRPPPHSESPRIKRTNIRSESLRHRCSDQKTDEIIRFVRDLQFERQPTSMRLQKKAPLPSIGQPAPPKAGTSDSGFLDRATDSNDSDEDLMDNEIYKCTSHKRSAPIDSHFIELLTCPRSNKRSNDHQILAKSLPQSHMDIYNNNTRMPPRQNSFVRHGVPGTRHTGHTGNQRHITKQLPPLSRDTFPERPSAPSPSRTPPLSDYGFIEEEPVDYIDL
ncbi:uncharacterized protein LOC128208443 [Mya arenaria]|uniref:uncharacterized protein LOC128208443 n=1 Tax=Mya arenaria TaxID=6604 RepID=UPI0022E4BC6A|nr:uncharacterized protein LOC128208443 [Mya arenaria]